MLFSDITDCEMLVYRCIQEADNEIGLVGIMDELEKRFPAFLRDNASGGNPQKGEYPLPFVVDDIIKSGINRVKVLETSDRWCGVTYKEDKENVMNTLQSMKDRGIYPERLFGTTEK